MTKTYTARTPEERIAEYQAKIQAIEERAERKRLRADPTIQAAVVAAKTLDRSIEQAGDGPIQEALRSARFLIAEALPFEVKPRAERAKRAASARNGAPKPRGRRAKESAAAE